MEREEIISEINRTLDVEAKSIARLIRDLDNSVMVRLVEKIARCKGRMVLSGCGTSAMAARKIAHSLCCVGCPARFLSPADAVHGALGVLQEGDMLILISKGGSTRELAALCPVCKKKKAELVVVSENLESELGRQADIFLKVKVEREPCRFNMLATASTLAVIATFDAICIALMEYKGYTREQFSVIHPSGAVGERLLHGEEIGDER